MQEFMDSIHPVALSRTRPNQANEQNTPSELKELQSLARKLNYLGHGAFPQASLVASRLQQNIPHLRVLHLQEGNTALHHLKKLSPSISYKATENGHTKEEETCYHLLFYDASTGDASYGQTGYIPGLSHVEINRIVYHILDWHSFKQSRVCFSSVGAEILAAADSADRPILLQECFGLLLLSQSAFSFVLTVAMYGLYLTITTLPTESDVRLHPTVSRLRYSFESCDIASLQKIPGKNNLTDALTKINPTMFVTLNDVMSSGLLPFHLLQLGKSRSGSLHR